MGEIAPVPAAASPAKATKKKPAARPKKAGLSVSDLITKAVSASKERRGVSLAMLKKCLVADGYDVEKNNFRVKVAVKSLVTKGVLVQTKGTGASGSFKVNKEAKKPAAKKAAAPKVKKPAAKKPAAVKKASPKKAKKPAAKKPAAAKKATPKKVKKVAAPKKAVSKSPKKVTKSPKRAAKPAAKKTPVKKVTKPKPKVAKKAAPKKK